MPSWINIPMGVLLTRLHEKRNDTWSYTWYNSLKIDQLMELCQAAKIPFSGTKTDLVSRLSNHPLGSLFAYHPKNGLTNAHLKEMCIERSLPKSGNRYAMVHRLLEHSGNVSANATAADVATAVSTKKRASLDPVATDIVPAAKKPRADDYQALYNKIQRMITTGTTDRRFLSHSDYVYQMVVDTLEAETKFQELKKDLAASKAIFISLTDNFNCIVSPGHDHRGNLGYSMKLLRRIVRNVKDALDNKEKVDLHNWLENLWDTIALYIDCIAEEILVDLMSDLETEIEDSNDGEEEEETVKPPAMPSISFTQAMRENEIPTTKHANTAKKVGSFSTYNVNQAMASTKEYQKPASKTHGSTVPKARPLQQHVPTNKLHQLPSIV